MDMYKKYSLSAYGLKFFPTYLPKDPADPDEFLFKVGVDGVKEKLREARDQYDFI